MFLQLRQSLVDAKLREKAERDAEVQSWREPREGHPTFIRIEHFASEFLPNSEPRLYEHLLTPSWPADSPVPAPDLPLEYKGLTGRDWPHQRYLRTVERNTSFSAELAESVAQLSPATEDQPASAYHAPIVAPRSLPPSELAFAIVQNRGAQYKVVLDDLVMLPELRKAEVGSEVDLGKVHFLFCCEYSPFIALA